LIVKICAAEFVTSATAEGGYPGERLPELALVGRSNVGKSSLINALVGRTVARTSAAPGKTRLANVYRVEPATGRAFHLIDLPGYGYARGGDAAVRAFEAVTTAYFDRVTEKRNPVSFQGESGETKPGFFAGALLLVDSRHPGLAADIRAWNWLAAYRVSRAVVATKLDKLTRAERQRHLKELNRIFEEPVTAVSAASGEGLEALWIQIARLLRQPPPKTAPPIRTSSR
jgi:GTP-binding protein